MKGWEKLCTFANIIIIWQWVLGAWNCWKQPKLYVWNFLQAQQFLKIFLLFRLWVQIWNFFLLETFETFQKLWWKFDFPQFLIYFQMMKLCNDLCEDLAPKWLFSAQRINVRCSIVKFQTLKMLETLILRQTTLKWKVTAFRWRKKRIEEAKIIARFT